jgi:dUTPase
MTFDQIVAKMKQLIKTGQIVADYPWDNQELLGSTPSFRAIAACFEEEVPEYRFALREDLKDDPRFLPTRATSGSVGWDVRAAQQDKKDIVLRPGEFFKIPLGFRAFCPEGWWYQLHPRSSSFTKKYMHNLVGIIDEDFPLQTLLVGQYIPDVKSLGHDLVIQFGDRIAQIIPVKRQEMSVKSISNEDYDNLLTEKQSTRKGGFGSTSR